MMHIVVTHALTIHRANTFVIVHIVTCLLWWDWCAECCCETSMYSVHCLSCGNPLAGFTALCVGGRLPWIVLACLNCQVTPTTRTVCLCSTQGLETLSLWHNVMWNVIACLLNTVSAYLLSSALILTVHHWSAPLLIMEIHIGGGRMVPVASPCDVGFNCSACVSMSFHWRMPSKNKVAVRTSMSVQSICSRR